MYTRIVSFLGLGPLKSSPPHYTPTQYAVGDIVSPETPFCDVVTALAAPGDAALVLIGTDRVHERFIASGIFEEHFRAHVAMERCPIVFITVKEGANDGERWDLFRVLTEALTEMPITWQGGAGRWVDRGQFAEPEPPSEIVVDVTRGFRSQPVFATAALAFTRAEWRRREVADQPLLRIQYAAFDKDRGCAPMWELTQLLDALDWNAAIDGLMRFGRADDLGTLLRAEQKRSVMSNDSQARYPGFARLGRAAATFADALVTARVPQVLTTAARSLRAAIAAARVDVETSLPPLEPTLEALGRWLDGLDADEPLDGAGLRASVALARLYGRLQRYSEMSALLRELLVSRFAFAAGPPALQPACGDKAFNEHRTLVERRASESGRAGHAGVSRALYELADLRNDVQHCAMRALPRAAADVRKGLEKSLEPVARLVDGRAFANCSNHPSAGWSPAQTEAALAMGCDEVVDIEGGFPNVPPTAELAELRALATRVVEQAIAFGASVAMVSGEQTLVPLIVLGLQAAGIVCVTATTERVCQDEVLSDGSVETRRMFRFVQWRRFPSLIGISSGVENR